MVRILVQQFVIGMPVTTACCTTHYNEPLLLKAGKYLVALVNNTVPCLTKVITYDTLALASFHSKLNNRYD